MLRFIPLVAAFLGGCAASAPASKPVEKPAAHPTSSRDALSDSRDMECVQRGLKAGCAAGDREQCLLESLLSASDAADVVRALEYDCSSGAGGSCSALGLAYNEGFGVDWDIPRAQAMWKRGCDLGDSLGCVELARSLLTEGADAEPERALELLAPICDKEDGRDACELLGWAHRTAPGGIARDDVAAARAYERACRLGSVSACGTFGAMQVGGRGVASDPAQGCARMARACEQNDRWSCDALAQAGELCRSADDSTVRF